MSTHFHDPIEVGEVNHPSTLNTRFGALDQAIYGGTGVLQDAIDALIIEAGTSDAETIAARTRINYLAGSPPDVLGDTIEHLGGNVLHVDAYGAVGDGTTDDAAAINAAITAAVSGDTIVFSSEKTYHIESSILVPAAKKDVTLWGYGATIESRDMEYATGTAPGLGTADSDMWAIHIESGGGAHGAGADRTKVLGFTMLGPINTLAADPSLTVTTLGESRGISIGDAVDHCQVRDCYVEGYRAGGIVSEGSYTTIQGNHCHRVRNLRQSGSGFGSIALSGGDSAHCSIIGNMVTEVQNCGIGGGNCNHSIVSGNVVMGTNWIGGGEAALGAFAMGMNFINKCHAMTISNNVVRQIAQEGIIITSGGANGGGISENNTISANQVIDCGFGGILLRAGGGTALDKRYCRRNTVIGNSVRMVGTPGPEQSNGIWLHSEDANSPVTSNSIIGNVISCGEDPGVDDLLDYGIRLQGAETRYTTITGNTIVRAKVQGIGIVSTNHNIADNILNTCNIGINLFGTDYSRVSNNIIFNTTGDAINIESVPTQLSIEGNAIQICTNGIDIESTSTDLCIYNNTIATASGDAINFAGVPTRCSVENNNISGCVIGIDVPVSSTDLRIYHNMISSTSSKSINVTGTPTRMRIKENNVDRKIDVSGASGTNFVVAYNPVGANGTSGVATLVAGTVTIPGAGFASTVIDGVIEVYRVGVASPATDTGVPYLANWEPGLGTPQITLKSTNAADDGTVGWRIIR